LRVISVFLKSLREQFRAPLVLGIAVLTGSTFMVIFGLAMGNSFYTHAVVVIDHDQQPGSRTFIKHLSEARYEDGNRLFDVRQVKEPSGLTADLQRQKLGAVISIPKGFSATLGDLERGERHLEPCELEVMGDPANAALGLKRLKLDSAFNAFLLGNGQLSWPFVLANRFLPSPVKGGGEFTYLAPGLMLMAIFLMLIHCAMVLVNEVQRGTMLRLRLSGLPTWQYLAGVGASQVLFASLMLPLMYTAAYAVGFRGAGNLGTAFVVGCASSLVAIAFGMVIAAFSRTVIEAFLWGNLMTIPVIFLSGVFFGVPDHVLFRMGGFTVRMMDWIPSYPAVIALKRVLLNGAALRDVTGELIKLLVTSTAFFALGAWLFKRTHLKKL